MGGPWEQYQAKAAPAAAADDEDDDAPLPGAPVSTQPAPAVAAAPEVGPWTQYQSGEASPAGLPQGMGARAAQSLAAAPAAGAGPAQDLPELGSRQWDPTFRKAAAAYNVSPALLKAIAKQESDFDPSAIGPDTDHGNAVGLMQFLPKTAKWVGVTDWTDPEQQIWGAARYMAYLKSKFGSDAAALAAYNWGEGNLKKWQSGEKSSADAVPKETRDYLQKVYGYAGLPRDDITPLVGEPTPIADAAKGAGTYVKNLGLSLAQGAGEGVGAGMKGAAALSSDRAYLEPYYDTYANFASLAPDQQEGIFGLISHDEMPASAKIALANRLRDAADGKPVLPLDEFAGPAPEQIPAQRAGTAVAEAARKNLAPDAGFEKTLSGRVAANIGAIVPGMGAAVVNPMLGAAYFGAQTAGDEADLAKTNGATPEQAATAARYGNLVGQAAGMVNIEAVLSPIRRFAPGAIGWASTKLAQAGRSGVTFASVGEAQEWLANQFRQEYNPEASYDFDPQRLLTGLISGAVLGAAHPTGRGEKAEPAVPAGKGAEAAPTAAEAVPGDFTAGFDMASQAFVVRDAQGNVVKTFPDGAQAQAHADQLNAAAGKDATFTAATDEPQRALPPGQTPLALPTRGQPAALPAPDVTYGDTFSMRSPEPAPAESGPRALPPPATTAGEGFTMGQDPAAIARGQEIQTLQATIARRQKEMGALQRQVAKQTDPAERQRLTGLFRAKSQQVDDANARLAALTPPEPPVDVQEAGQAQQAPSEPTAAPSPIQKVEQAAQRGTDEAQAMAGEPEPIDTTLRPGETNLQAADRIEAEMDAHPSAAALKGWLGQHPDFDVKSDDGPRNDQGETGPRSPAPIGAPEAGARGEGPVAEAARPELAEGPEGSGATPQRGAGVGAPVLDHGVLNLPLSARGDIDKQIDRYKADQARQERAARKERTTATKVAKAQARQLFDQFADQMVSRYGGKLGTRAQVRKTLDGMVKWQPDKFIALAEKFRAEQSPKPLPTPTPERPEPAKPQKIPFIKTKEMRDGLRALGMTQEQIDATSPVQAVKLLDLPQYQRPLQTPDVPADNQHERALSPATIDTAGFGREHIGGGAFAYTDPNTQPQRFKAQMAINGLLGRIAGEGKVRVRVVDHIGTPEGGEAYGAYIKRNNTIYLTHRDIDTIGSAHHEVVHFLRETGGLDGKAWDILADKAQREWRAKYEIDRAYAEDVADWRRIGMSDRWIEDRLNEEAVAFAATDLADGKLRAKGIIGRALEAVRQAVEMFRNLVAGRGFRSAKGVLADIQAGKMADRGAGGSHPSEMAPAYARQPYEKDFPSIVIQRPDSSPVRVRAHPDYTAAKAGDMDAAVRLVSDVVDPFKVNRIRSLIGNRKPTIVPVHSEEAAGRNAIPRAYAEVLGDRLGLPVDDEIVHANQPMRTGSSALHRVTTPSVFDGPVKKGENYFLVDDHVTQGGTLADLRAHIEEGGGHVIGATTLTGNDKSARLAPMASTISALRQKFPDLEPWWKEQFGHDFNGLTQSEAVYLLRYNSAKSIRDSIAARRREASVGAGEGTDRGDEAAADGRGVNTSPDDDTPAFQRAGVRERAGDLADRLAAAPPIERAKDFMGSVVEDIQRFAVPMAQRGTSDRARAVAKDFANAIRRAHWQTNRSDDFLKKNFTPDEWTGMWNAMDDASTAAQRAMDAGADRAAALRAGQEVLRRLPTNQRMVLEEMSRHAQELWQKAVDAGMVKGEGLPFWTPRMGVMIGEDGTFGHLQGEGEGAPSLESMGRNLTTNSPNLKGRKYLTAEETEQAMRAKFGRGAQLVRDIRAMPLAMGRLERAIAGRELVNQIKAIGERVGTETVSDSEKPGSFTLDHPALKTFKPRLEEVVVSPQTIERRGLVIRDRKVFGGNSGEELTSYRVDGNGNVAQTVWAKDDAGNVIYDKAPLYISKEFEGPLRAVLTSKPNAVYNAMMALKAKSMGLIMYSPLIHNAVEFGRALPVMPGKVVTFRVYGDGARALADQRTMEEALNAGVAPIGHRGQFNDITSIAEEPNLKPGRSWTAQGLGYVAEKALGREAGDAVRRAVDTAGDWYHNKLLWDQVAKLQMGLYVNVRDSLLSHGTEPAAATKIAAHFANRYAGALPHEAMGEMARRLANLTMFSRTFTIGNLGVMKDMITGLPADVQAQLRREIGDAATDNAVKIAKRKARAAFTLDIGLMLAANATLATAAALMMGQSVDDQQKALDKRFHRMIGAIKENPWHLLNPLFIPDSLSPTADNEPGKERRIKVGHDKNGTAIYARVPTGKIGEEFVDWLTSPLAQMKKKMSTFLRPTADILINDAGWSWGPGHRPEPVYDPHGNVAKMAGQIAWHFLKAQEPDEVAQYLWDTATGQKPSGVDTLKAVGPLAGITFSKGAPGGEAMGEYYAAKGRHEIEVQQHLPEINKLLKAGKTDEAVGKMQQLGMDRGEIKSRLKGQTAPASRLTSNRLKQFERFATPEEKARMRDVLSGR